MSCFKGVLKPFYTVDHNLYSNNGCTRIIKLLAKPTDVTCKPLGNLGTQKCFICHKERKDSFLIPTLQTQTMRLEKSKL